jgi:hypothetical protein
MQSSGNLEGNRPQMKRLGTVRRSVPSQKRFSNRISGTFSLLVPPIIAKGRKAWARTPHAGFYWLIGNVQNWRRGFHQQSIGHGNPERRLCVIKNPTTQPSKRLAGNPGGLLLYMRRMAELLQTAVNSIHLISAQSDIEPGSLRGPSFRRWISY